MKKILILLICLFTFSNTIYADSMYCYIAKEENENVILKSDDEIKVFFNSSFDENELVSAKYQLYYDPYIFEIVKNNDEYVFHSEKYEINNVKVYSSIIEFEVLGNNSVYENYDIYVKFKVRKNAKKDDTTIELIGNNSNIKQILSYQIDGVEKSSEEKADCVNSKLLYTIDNNDEVKNDSYLSYLNVDSDIGYMTPVFYPKTFEYNVYLYNINSTISLDAVCAVEGCGVDDYFVGEIKENKTVYLETKNNDSIQKYRINFIIPNENNYEIPKLDDLKVIKYDILEEFNPYNKTYHVIIPEEENSLLIDYKSNDEVRIDGNDNFKIGENIVTITASNQYTYVKYYIVVQKEEKEVIEPQKNNEEETKEEINKNDKKDPLMAQNIIIGLIIISMLIAILVFAIKDKEN